MTSIMIAATKGDVLMVEILILAGADPNIQCESVNFAFRNRTALEMAKDLGKTSIVWRIERYVDPATEKSKVTVKRRGGGISMEET